MQLNCPHCGELVECAEKDPLLEIECSNCGIVVGIAATVAMNADGLEEYSRDNSPQDYPKKFGRYIVMRQLGAGGMGDVYLALDQDLGRQVAVKVPKAIAFNSNERVDVFLAEARNAARLDHPSIVTIHDVGRTADKSCFIVMEYVAGSSLKDAIQSKDDGLTQRIDLLCQAAEAVDYAHTNGLVHRDLKPDNILIDAKGKARVADFGLAIHEDDQKHRAGEYAGTVCYMSPEQIRGEAHRLDGRTDVWALGVILYEMLTAKRPFYGDDAAEVSDEILHREPKPPRQVDNSISRHLERVCLRSLKKEIADRYPTAGDFAEELRLANRSDVSTGTISGSCTRDESANSPKGKIAARFDVRTLGCSLSVSLALATSVVLLCGLSMLSFRPTSPDSSEGVESLSSFGEAAAQERYRTTNPIRQRSTQTDTTQGFSRTQTIWRWFKRNPVAGLAASVWALVFVLVFSLFRLGAGRRVQEKA